MLYFVIRISNFVYVIGLVYTFSGIRAYSYFEGRTDELPSLMWLTLANQTLLHELGIVFVREKCSIRTPACALAGKRGGCHPFKITKKQKMFTVHCSHKYLQVLWVTACIFVCILI